MAFYSFNIFPVCLVSIYLHYQYLPLENSSPEHVDKLSMRCVAISMILLSLVMGWTNPGCGTIFYLVFSGPLACLKLRMWCNFWTMATIQTAGLCLMIWIRHNEVKGNWMTDDVSWRVLSVYAWYVWYAASVIAFPLCRFIHFRMHTDPSPLPL